LTDIEFAALRSEWRKRTNESLRAAASRVDHRAKAGRRQGARGAPQESQSEREKHGRNGTPMPVNARKARSRRKEQNKTN
jgi:hypothetical protein